MKSLDSNLSPVSYSTTTEDVGALGISAASAVRGVAPAEAFTYVDDSASTPLHSSIKDPPVVWSAPGSSSGYQSNDGGSYSPDFVAKSSGAKNLQQDLELLDNGGRSTKCRPTGLKLNLSAGDGDSAVKQGKTGRTVATRAPPALSIAQPRVQQASGGGVVTRRASVDVYRSMPDIFNANQARQVVAKDLEKRRVSYEYLCMKVFLFVSYGFMILYFNLKFFLYRIHFDLSIIFVDLFNKRITMNFKK